MRRRDFIRLLGGAAAWPVAAWAQQARQPMIGVLALTSKAGQVARLAALRDGLRGLGYVEGQNILIGERYADADVKRLPTLAHELFQLKPAVIFADSPSAVLAMNKAAPSMPIVCPTFSDAMVPSVAASYAHPGGSVTGISLSVEGIVGKLVEQALDAIPGINRIGFLSNPTGASIPLFERQVEANARTLGAQVVIARATNSEGLVSAFRQLSTAKVQAVIVPANSLFTGEKNQIIVLASAARLPLICSERAWVEAGGLLSYGVDVIDTYRRAAVYLDKILKGASPGNLPIEFPTKIELAINLQTAKAFGLSIPPTVLARADEVIE
jgi:putative ABC transport system substrate-binding protein